MKKIFINHTNHPKEHWSAEQISAAKVYGEILDMAFPAISATATAQEIRELVKRNLKKILELKPAVVLCQGEFNYTFAMVEELKKLGIKVVAATSERVVAEEILSDDSTQKISNFRFVQFREY